MAIRALISAAPLWVLLGCALALGACDCGNVGDDAPDVTPLNEPGPAPDGDRTPEAKSGFCTAWHGDTVRREGIPKGLFAVERARDSAKISVCVGVGVKDGFEEPAEPCKETYVGYADAEVEAQFERTRELPFCRCLRRTQTECLPAE